MRNRGGKEGCEQLGTPEDAGVCLRLELGYRGNPLIIIQKLYIRAV